MLFAIEVLVDSVNAISGYASLAEGKLQHHIVSPAQERLGGCLYKDRNIEQFVARSTGEGSVAIPFKQAVDTGFSMMEIRVIPLKKKDMQIRFRSYEREIKFEVKEDDVTTDVGKLAIAFNTFEPKLLPGYPKRMYFEQTFDELVLQDYDKPQSNGLKSVRIHEIHNVETRSGC